MSVKIVQAERTRDGEIGKPLHQEFCQVTEETANVPYVTQAVRSHLEMTNL